MSQVGGILTVVTSPSDANMRFNDIPVEPKTPVLLDPGSIRIHVSKHGYEPDSLIIVLVPGDTLMFDIRLQPHIGEMQLIPTPLQSTWSLIDSTGAVYLSGIGMTRKTDIQTGIYTLRVEHPGLAPIEQTLRIKRSMTTSLSVELTDQDSVDRGVMRDPVRAAPYQLSWEGDIQRAPLQQPLPRYEVDIETVISIRFEVRADGTVGRIQPVQRIEPNLERELLNILRKWRFSRLPSSVPQESQWGRITFRFSPE
jgi:TonB family protein